MSFTIFSHFEIFDFFVEFGRAHANWDFDKFFTLIIVVAAAGLVFSLRRLDDLRAEVKKLRQAEKQAEALARHDPLTGLPNRRDFLDRARNELVQGSRCSESAFFIVDLDLFKPVNDLYGHKVGDETLCEVARRLKRAIDGQGTAARLGGDEFGILLPNLQNKEAAERIARRIVHDISDTIYVGSLAIQIGVSIGVTLITCDDEASCRRGDDKAVDHCVQQCLRRADMAMYKAKTEGRGQFRFFEKEMDEKLKLHVRMEAELADAIEARQIVPFYQSFIDLSTGELKGFEILARWRHPERGIIPPDVFIPIAEDTGVISTMTLSLLQQALEDAKTWPDELLLSLNLSPRQLANKWISQELLGVLMKNTFPPHRLQIEITESGILERLDDVRGILSSLRNVGVKIALDDFGTGYSGLNHLRDLHIDTVKIDRSFVTDMLENKEDGKIVEAVVKLSSAMGLTSVAEGIESAAVIKKLSELGCVTGQGFYFNKPQPAGTIREMLRASRFGAQRDAG